MAGKAGGKSKKAGRDLIRCKVYRGQMRRDKNKLRRLHKHLKRFPNDHCATGAVGNLKTRLGVYA